MLPAPFFGWLGTLMFLLLMQFLIRYLPDIVGKGLPFGVIVELIAYNLAYMVVLAVPMSVLIASLMAFGRLAETNAYLVIKSSGVSLLQLAWPSFILAVLVTIAMGYFNNEILPEANFRAKNLWQDIRRTKPGFELQPGVFYNGLRGYTIMARDIPPKSNELYDVLIYDNGETSGEEALIKAAKGRIVPQPNGDMVDLILEDGEVHQNQTVLRDRTVERYQRLSFDRFRIRFDLSDFNFERSDPRVGYRSDRTMRTADMRLLVDSLRMSLENAHQKLIGYGMELITRQPTQEPTQLATPTSIDSGSFSGTFRDRYVTTAGLDGPTRRILFDEAMQKIRTRHMEVDDIRRTILWESRRLDRYRVEIHKKYSIAFACIIFLLIGAPLGLRLKRGGLGIAGALAIGIFLFYWVTLVQGEKMADRDMLSPWFGMWIANIVVAVAGAILTLSHLLHIRIFPWRRALK